MRNMLVSCDHGTFIVNKYDYDALTYAGQSEWLLHHGNSCANEAAIAFANIRVEDPIIFDIGCNIGTFTSWMAKRYRGGIIYAFEPQRIVHQMACGNMALNNFDNVYLYNVAIGKENSTITIEEPSYYDLRDYGTFSLVNDMGFNKSRFTSVIDVVTVDWFVCKHKVDRINLLKIDAEGMDLDVLEGAFDSIQRFSPAILVEHVSPNGSIFNQLCDVLKGYKIHCVNNNILAVV